MGFNSAFKVLKSSTNSDIVICITIELHLVLNNMKYAFRGMEGLADTSYQKFSPLFSFTIRKGLKPFCFFGPCIFNMGDKKIKQQTAQINSGLIYY